MTGPQIVVEADAAAANRRAASIIADTLRDAVAARGRADWTTSGGSTPVGIYRAMVDSDNGGAIPWTDVHTWWGDDRFVPSDHPLSNVKPFDDIMLGIGLAEEGTAGGRGPGVPIPIAPAGNIRRQGLEVLHGGGEKELIARAGKTSQPHTLEAVD